MGHGSEPSGQRGVSTAGARELAIELKRQNKKLRAIVFPGHSGSGIFAGDLAMSPALDVRELRGVKIIYGASNASNLPYPSSDPPLSLDVVRAGLTKLGFRPEQIDQLLSPNEVAKILRWPAGIIGGRCELPRMMEGMSGAEIGRTGSNHHIVLASGTADSVPSVGISHDRFPIGLGPGPL